MDIQTVLVVLFFITVSIIGNGFAQEQWRGKGATSPPEEGKQATYPVDDSGAPTYPHDKKREEGNSDATPYPEKDEQGKYPDGGTYPPIIGKEGNFSWPEGYPDGNGTYTYQPFTEDDIGEKGNNEFTRHPDKEQDEEGKDTDGGGAATTYPPNKDGDKGGVTQDKEPAGGDPTGDPTDGEDDQTSQEGDGSGGKGGQGKSTEGSHAVTTKSPNKGEDNGRVTREKEQGDSDPTGGPTSGEDDQSGKEGEGGQGKPTDGSGAAITHPHNNEEDNGKVTQAKEQGDSDPTGGPTSGNGDKTDGSGAAVTQPPNKGEGEDGKPTDGSDAAIRPTLPPNTDEDKGGVTPAKEQGGPTSGKGDKTDGSGAAITKPPNNGAGGDESDSKPEAPTVIAAVALKVDAVYTPKLEDPESTEYKTLKKDSEDAAGAAFVKQYPKTFKSVNVTGFQKGSIVANMVVTFDAVIKSEFGHSTGDATVSGFDSSKLIQSITATIESNIPKIGNYTLLNVTVDSVKEVEPVTVPVPTDSGNEQQTYRCYECSTSTSPFNLLNHWGNDTCLAKQNSKVNYHVMCAVEEKCAIRTTANEDNFEEKLSFTRGCLSERKCPIGNEVHDCPGRFCTFCCTADHCNDESSANNMAPGFAFILISLILAKTVGY